MAQAYGPISTSTRPIATPKRPIRPGTTEPAPPIARPHDSQAPDPTLGP